MKLRILVLTTLLTSLALIAACGASESDVSQKDRAPQLKQNQDDEAIEAKAEADADARYEAMHKDRLERKTTRSRIVQGAIERPEKAVDDATDKAKDAANDAKEDAENSAEQAAKKLPGGD